MGLGCSAAEQKGELPAELSGRGFSVWTAYGSFYVWQQLIWVILDYLLVLEQRRLPGTQVHPAGISVCKYLITSAAFPKELRNIFPWAQEFLPKFPCTLTVNIIFFCSLLPAPAVSANQFSNYCYPVPEVQRTLNRSAPPSPPHSRIHSQAFPVCPVCS